MIAKLAKSGLDLIRNKLDNALVRGLLISLGLELVFIEKNVGGIRICYRRGLRNEELNPKL